MKFGRKFNKQLKTGHIGNIKVVSDAVKLKGILPGADLVVIRAVTQLR